MRTVELLSPADMLVQALATCHSLAVPSESSSITPLSKHENCDGRVDVTSERHAAPRLSIDSANSHTVADGVVSIAGLDATEGEELSQQHLVGDTMEIQLFQLTKWTLSHTLPPNLSLPPADYSVVYPPGTGNLDSFDSIPLDNDLGFGAPYPGNARTPHADCLVILRDFAFSSALQRSTVVVGCVVHGQQGPLFVFAKGAPEKIQALCSEDSLPSEFSEQVRHYARHGYRVLALAGAPLLNVTWNEVIERRK